MMASSGTIALFATPFALVTANLGRFLLAIFLCFLGFASMTTLKTSWHGFDTSMPALSESRAIIASCLLFSTSIAVILIQLRPRRTKLANGVLYTGYTVAIVSLLAWPWPFPNRTSDPESPATSQIAARPVSIRPVAAASRQNSTYQVNFELSGIPPNHYLTGGTDKKHRLVWPDSEPKVWIKTPSPFRIPLSTAGVLLNLETAHHAVPRSASASYNVTMPPEFTERSVSTPVLYEMGGNFHLHAPHVLGEVPLEPGAVLEKNANRTRVVGIQDKVGHRIVALVNSRPSRYHSYNTTLPQPFGLGAHHFQPIYPGAFTHYLVNRRLNRLFESASTELHGERVRYCTIAFVEIHWREVSFKIADESATSSGDLGADDDLTLASIASEVIASFKRTVVFPASAFLPPVSN